MFKKLEIDFSKNHNLCSAIVNDSKFVSQKVSGPSEHPLC